MRIRKREVVVGISIFIAFLATIFYILKWNNIHENIELEPMRSYERKIIHDTVQNIDGVYSWSEGLNDERHVIISESIKKKSD